MKRQRSKKSVEDVQKLIISRAGIQLETTGPNAWQRIPADVIDIIVYHVIVESGWTYKETVLNMLERIPSPLKILMANALRRSNRIWKHWFELEFSIVAYSDIPGRIVQGGPARDIALELPPWIANVNNPIIPWRRYYHWTRYFRRKAIKSAIQLLQYDSEYLEDTLHFRGILYTRIEDEDNIEEPVIGIAYLDQQNRLERTTMYVGGIVSDMAEEHHQTFRSSLVALPQFLNMFIEQQIVIPADYNDIFCDVMGEDAAPFFIAFLNWYNQRATPEDVELLATLPSVPKRGERVFLGSTI